MRPTVRTYLVDDDGNRVFGPGPAELLRRIREHGSLRAASISMNMAYTKALALVRNAERGLGAPLTRRAVGGVGGGGSTPTPEADEGHAADGEAGEGHREHGDSRKHGKDAAGSERNGK